MLGTLGGRVRERGDEATAAEIESLAGEMRARIDHQLRLSQLRMRPGSHALSSDLRPALDRVLVVIRRSERGERLVIDVDVPARLAADIDGSDLVELLGVLLENATRWATSRVRIGAMRRDGHIELSIADDGPGLSEAEIARVKLPGETLDVKGDGTGLGLPIAIEIAQINGPGDAGGLEVRVVLAAA